MEKQKKKDKSYLLALVLLLLSGFFILLFILPDGKKSESLKPNAAHSKEYEERVNKHLFKTAQDIELSHEKMQIEMNDLANKGIGPQALPKEDVHKLDFSADPRAEALMRELGRGSRESTGPSNADEQVQADLFQEEQSREYSEAYKKEYARQFVENARKAGYLIKLSDDYKVISVRPIRKPAENYELFKADSHGAQ